MRGREILPLTVLARLGNTTERELDRTHCTRGPDGPRVDEIVTVEDQSAGFDATQFTTTDVFRRERRDQPLEWTGLLPIRAARAFEEAGYDLRRLLGVPDQAVQAGSGVPR